MKETKKSNKKFLFGIALAVVSIFLCYMFVVLYFFFISPNNIPTKLALWPFLSQDSIGEMYLDATVDIKFKSTEGFFEKEESFEGVVIKENGFVIAPLHSLQGQGDAQLEIYVNSGKIFGADIVYAEENLDIAILKCKNLDGVEKGKISLPYVSVAKTSSKAETKVLAVSAAHSQQDVRAGEMSNSKTNFALKKTVEDVVGVDFVLEDCNLMTLSSQKEFSGGAIFDMSGNLLGFSYRDAKDETGKYVVQDVSKSNLFLKEFFRAQDKKQAYENALAESFSGLDKTEILFHKEVSNQEGGRKNVFYFQNEWKEYDENLNSFFASETDGFFLLKDFVYGQTKIESGSVITKIETKDAIHEIDSKNALVAAVYEAKKGQNVKIEFLSSQSQQEENVAFSV